MLIWDINSDPDDCYFSPLPIKIVCDICGIELEDPRTWMAKLMDDGTIQTVHKVMGREGCDDGLDDWVEGAEFLHSLLDRVRMIDVMYNI